MEVDWIGGSLRELNRPLILSALAQYPPAWSLSPLPSGIVQPGTSSPTHVVCEDDRFFGMTVPEQQGGDPST